MLLSFILQKEILTTISQRQQPCNLFFSLLFILNKTFYCHIFGYLIIRIVCEAISNIHCIFILF